MTNIVTMFSTRHITKNKIKVTAMKTIPSSSNGFVKASMVVLKNYCKQQFKLRNFTEKITNLLFISNRIVHYFPTTNYDD